ncbi:MAG: CHAT domain-containing protein, partial [Bifidobacteriaceae bacterium]|nr:CHAT domain-containing protein [Bifidobacteriaceae bacterium]
MTIGNADAIRGASELTLTEASTLLSRSTEAASEADRRLKEAGEKLARALLPGDSLARLATLAERLLPEQRIDLVVRGEAAVLGAIPVELARLPGATRALALEPGVAIRRQVEGAPRQRPVSLAGPLKILAGVSAPDEDRASNPPLDVEREMQRILDATKVAGPGQVKILEYAHPDLIVGAVQADEYHVLHLSAHGTATTLALEDEDGGTRLVGAQDLVAMLRRGGAPIPLIVLSSCSDLDGRSLAGELVDHGADRVVAMQAPVADDYATELADALYSALIKEPGWSVAEALASARRALEARRQAIRHDYPDRPAPPEWTTAALWSASDDAPLLDQAAQPAPLSSEQEFPAGGHVRELPLGQLIGRRPQVRQALGVLRRTERAVEQFGATGGIVLTGLGGIGKTAIAGRVIQRLRDDGWLPVVVEGAWNPSRLLLGAAEAIAAKDRTLAQTLAEADDDIRLPALHEALRRHRLLLVLDDFEQNLGPAGQAFRGGGGGASLVAETVGDLAATACAHPDGGGLLVTCRYPLPLPFDGPLTAIAVPALSDAELGRLLLRLPALKQLPAQDQHVLRGLTGGHPRLIELMDAILRGRKRSQYHEVALRIAEALTRRDLSITHNKIGDTELRAGRLDAARQHHEAALRIAEALTQANPADSRAQRDLSISHNRVGDVELRAGRLDAARKHHETALRIDEALARADPADSEAQRDLSISHINLGDMDLRAGRI